MQFSLIRRSAGFAAASALVAGLIVAVAPTPAFANDACKPGDGEEITPDTEPLDKDDLEGTVPWAQTQLGVDRLKTLATGKDVTVAVLDSGVDAQHTLLKDKVVGGRAYVDIEGKKTSSGSADVDCNGHGTAVASLIAGRPAKTFGFQGIAPDADILSYRVSVTAGDAKTEDGKDDDKDGLTESAFADAIDQAVADGADVINMSLKYDYQNQDIADAIARAVDKKVVLVAAAGNDGCEWKPDKGVWEAPDMVWPASYDNVIGVGAVDKDINISKNSECGKWVDVVAPGDGLVSAMPDNKYTLGVGATSAATAFVSGTAALLKQQHDNWSTEQIADQITATASPVSGGKNDLRYGNGLIDPYRALTESQMDSDPVPMDGMVTSEMDAAAQQRRADYDRMHTTGLWVGFGALVVFTAALLGVGALRRGRKRSWRVSRVDKTQQVATFDDGDPIQLYQGIKGLKE